MNADSYTNTSQLVITARKGSWNKTAYFTNYAHEGTSLAGGLLGQVSIQSSKDLGKGKNEN